MDFKTRFNGKMTQITKDGAIDIVIKSSVQPITKMSTINSDCGLGGVTVKSAKQIISYGGGSSTELGNS